MGESSGEKKRKERDRKKRKRQTKKQISEYASKTLNDHFICNKAFFNRTNEKFWHFTSFSLFIKSF